MNTGLTSFLLASSVLLGVSQAALPTCLAVDANISSDITVSETASISAFSLHASKTWMDIGEQQQLTVISPENDKISGMTWHSSDDSVCSVDAQGVVTAVSNGCAEITCSLDDFSAKLSIHVGLSKPEITSISLTDSGSISLTWSPVPDCDGYRVYYRASDTAEWEACETLTTVQWTDELRYTGGEYSVRAFKLRNSQTDDALTLWSSYSSAASSSEIPSVLAPTHFSAVSDSPAHIKLSWNASSHADGYFIYRKAQNDTAWTLLTDITDGTKESYTDTSVTADSTYLYTIRSYLLRGEEHMLSTFDADGISCSVLQPPKKENTQAPAVQAKAYPVSHHENIIYAQYTANTAANTFADVIAACKSIDGTTIDAGESYSFDITGSSAKQHSISGSIFTPALIQVPLENPGFCKVSDALYQLARRGDLPVTTASNNTPKNKPVSAVSSSIQLTNTTDHPLMLKAVFCGGVLRLQLIQAQ